MIVSSKVPDACNEMNVIAYLAARFTYLSASAWAQLLEEGSIACNGVRCELATTVRRGDSVRCQLPDFQAPIVNFDYSILYQDPWLLAINKPPGLRVHSSGKFVTANLIYHLRHLHLPPYPEANLVNRLDADTSGLVLLARDKEVLSRMMRSFAQGEVVKEYLAVVSGCPDPASGTINLPIGPVAGARVPRFSVDSATGKGAITHYRSVRHLSKDYTLLALRPVTGRTHQLRVHLAAIGHPIAGDRLYTMNDHDYLQEQRHPSLSSPMQRQALHSHLLEFTHPVSQAPCALFAPLAPDITRFIAALTGEEEEAVAGFRNSSLSKPGSG